MQLSHVITELEAAVENQLRLADPDVAETGSQFLNALMPAIRESMMRVASLAAAEVSSQLATQKVELRLNDGDPELVVTEDGSASPPPPPEGADEDEARITVRLPGYLKDLIAEAADVSGESVNAYVVDSLNTTVRKPDSSRSSRHRTTIEL